MVSCTSSCCSCRNHQLVSISKSKSASSSSSSSSSWLFLCIMITLQQMQQLTSQTMIRTSYSSSNNRIRSVQQQQQDTNNNNILNQVNANKVFTRNVSPISTKPAIRLGYVGNSLLYHNDCPRLVEQMLLSIGITVSNDVCFIQANNGGSLVQLANDNTECQYRTFFGPTSELVINTDGTVSYDSSSSPITVQSQLMKYTKTNGNTDKNDGYDYIILNDDPQRLVVQDGSQQHESINVIKDTYVPLIQGIGKRGLAAVPILIQSPPYKNGHTDGVSNFTQFTNKIMTGVKEYEKVFNDNIITSDSSTTTILKKVRIAPVGDVYQHIYNTDEELFEKLYAKDGIHPSPYGTYVQACIIFLTCFPELQLPDYNPQWWTTIRYFNDEQNDLTTLTTSTNDNTVLFPNLPSLDDAFRIHNATQTIVQYVPTEDDIAISKSNGSTNEKSNGTPSTITTTTTSSPTSQGSDLPSFTPSTLNDYQQIGTHTPSPSPSLSSS